MAGLVVVAQALSKAQNVAVDNSNRFYMGDF